MVFRNIPITNGRDEIPDGFLETFKPAYELTDDEIEAVFSGLFPFSVRKSSSVESAGSSSGWESA